MEKVNVMAVRNVNGNWHIVNSEEAMNKMAERLAANEKVELGTVGAFKTNQKSLNLSRQHGGYFFDGKFIHHLKDYDVKSWHDEETKENVVLLIARDAKEAAETEVAFDVNEF